MNNTRQQVVKRLASELPRDFRIAYEDSLGASLNRYSDFALKEFGHELKVEAAGQLEYFASMKVFVDTAKAHNLPYAELLSTPQKGAKFAKIQTNSLTLGVMRTESKKLNSAAHRVEAAALNSVIEPPILDMFEVQKITHPASDRLFVIVQIYLDSKSQELSIKYAIPFSDCSGYHFIITQQELLEIEAVDTSTLDPILKVKKRLGEEEDKRDQQ